MPRDRERLDLNGMKLRDSPRSPFRTAHNHQLHWNGGKIEGVLM